SLDFRLFEGTHAADIAAPSVKEPTGVLSRQQMIADLKVVRKTLDAVQFEKLRGKLGICLFESNY
ncbi:hypothetical protein A2U01_0070382, partial [Trifolium medium]|nr:hypothetical protein [Trifolium medium]